MVAVGRCGGPLGVILGVVGFGCRGDGMGYLAPIG